MNPPSRSPSQPSGLESGRTCVGNPAFLLRGTQQADVKTIDTPQKVRYFLAGFREQCCTILAVLHDISLLAYRVGGFGQQASVNIIRFLLLTVTTATSVLTS